MKENKNQVETEEKQATEEELFQQRIDGWKAAHGKIFKTGFGDIDIIWKKLKRKEYVNIMSTGSKEEGSAGMYARQDMITLSSVLFPDNIRDLIEDNAGLSTSLSDEITMKSGFDVSKTREL